MGDKHADGSVQIRCHYLLYREWNKHFIGNWGSEGWDAGSWPYIIFAIARTRDSMGELFGYGTYVEGYTSTYWFRSQDACFEAITAEVFFPWSCGQSDGPDNLPATATATELPEQDRKPYVGWTS